MLLMTFVNTTTNNILRICCSIMSGGYDLVSLSGEYGKHLSSVVLNNINHIHILLYDLIPTNLSYFCTTISKIDSLIKFCQNISHQVVNNIPSIQGLLTDCQTGNSGYQNSVSQIKPNLEKLKTLLPDLYDSYGYINYLRIETEKIIKSPKDASGPNSNVYRLIKAFSCSLSEFSEIERLLNSARSTIQEIKKTRDQLTASTSEIGTQQLYSVCFQIKCCCDNIDRIGSSICDVEFYTLCLKYWICKFVNSSKSNVTLSTTLSGNYIDYYHYYYASIFVNSFYSYYDNINQGDLKKIIESYTKILTYLKCGIECFQYIISPVIYIFKCILKDVNELVSKMDQYVKCLDTKTSCYITQLILDIQCLIHIGENGQYLQNLQLSIQLCVDEFKQSICAEIAKLKCINFDFLTLISMLFYLKHCNSTFETHLGVLWRVSQNLNNLGHITFYINMFSYSLIGNIDKLKSIIYISYIFCCYINYYLFYIICIYQYLVSLCSTLNSALEKLKSKIDIKIHEFKCSLECNIILLHVSWKCKIPSFKDIFCCVDKIKDSLCSYLSCLSVTLLHSSLIKLTTMYHKNAVCNIQKKMKDTACLIHQRINTFLTCSIKDTIFEVNWMSLETTANNPNRSGLNFLINTNQYSNKLQLLTLSYMTMIETRIYWLYLTERIFRYYSILNIVIHINGSCCICCYESANKKDKLVSNEYLTSMDRHLQFYLRSTTDNHGNNLCLCLVTKYLLFGNVRTLMCYMRDIVGDLYSSVSRRFDKYTHSTTYMFSVGKLIMMIISVIYKLTLWMKLNYLCTCPGGCPCWREGPGSCPCDCRICHQPAVPCCTCTNQRANCSSNTNGANNNNSCSCKCSQKNGQGCSRCCSGRCSSNGCCRCCCNCFCKNYEHPYYPYLISTILFVSSLIENIWNMDSETVRRAIEKLSSLLAEYQSLHVYTNYYTPSRYNIIRFISGLTNGKLIQGTLSHSGIRVGDSSKTSLLFKSRLSGIITVTQKEDKKTIFGTITAQRIGLFEDPLKCGFISFRSLILGTRFSKDKLTLIYNKFSCLCYSCQTKITDGKLDITNLFANIPLEYLNEICKQETCRQTCCQKNGVCRICPVAKIKIGCMSISFKDMGLIIGNVSGDMLLNYLIESIDRSRDFITNLCIGFGEVYTIMLKNNLLTHPNNDISINPLNTVKSTNWGYDTHYEHDVTTLSNNKLSPKLITVNRGIIDIIQNIDTHLPVVPT